MSEHFGKFYKDQKTALLILSFAFTASLFIFAGLLWFDFMPPAQSPMPLNLQYFGIIPAIISLFFFYKKRTPIAIAEQIKNGTPNFNSTTHELVKKLTDEEKRLGSFFPHFTNPQIISFACNEAIVILGLLAYMVSGISKEQFLISFCTGLALNIFMFPKVDQMFEEVKQLLQLP